MQNEPERQEEHPEAKAGPSPKIVAEMPGDEDMREQMKEWKETDGYPGSCGGV